MPMQQPHGNAEPLSELLIKLYGALHVIHGIAALYQRTYDIRLLSGFRLFLYKFIHILPLVLRHKARGHRFSARRQLVYAGYRQISVKYHREGARYWRGAHYKHIRCAALGPDSRPLLYAKSVLLVRYHHPQIVKLHIAL